MEEVPDTSRMYKDGMFRVLFAFDILGVDG